MCASCLDNARSLSSLCEPGDPKTQLDNDTSHLHDNWDKLGALFGDVLAKLTEALVQTQEFKSIAGTIYLMCSLHAYIYWPLSTVAVSFPLLIPVQVVWNSG